MNLLYLATWLVILLLVSKRSAEPDNFFSNYPMVLALLSILAFSACLRNPIGDAPSQLTSFILCAGAVLLGFCLAKRPRGSK